MATVALHLGTRYIVNKVVEQVLDEVVQAAEKGASGSVLFTPAIPHMTFDVFDELLDGMVKIGLVCEKNNRFFITEAGNRRIAGIHQPLSGESKPTWKGALDRAWVTRREAEVRS